MSKYLLQTFELPQPSADHYVAMTPIDPPTGYELHSWKTVSSPDESGRWGLAEMLWEKDVSSIVTAGLGKDVVVFWRGAVSDLVTDLAEKLTVEQLQELAGEATFAWRQKRTGVAP